jgi:anti-sigma factor RsiW
MTACAEWNDRLLDLALGASATRELETHLLTCPACSSALQEMRTNSEQLDAALRTLVQGAEPSRTFRARLAASLETSSFWSFWSLLWVQRAVAVAVLGVIALVGIGVLPVRRHFTSDESNRAATTVATLSEWHSPTQTLLGRSGDQSLRPAPRLHDFYFPLPPTSRSMGARPKRKGPSQP